MTPSRSDSPSSQGAPRRWSGGAILGALAAIAGIVAAGIAAMDFFQKRQPYDLTGEWQITNNIESAKLKAFEGLRLEFRIFLDQNGFQLGGRGEKVAENGRQIPIGNRTRIVVHSGTIVGQRVRATFEEFGAERTTIGIFEWSVEPGGQVMNGRFTSLASDSHGSSRAERRTTSK